ncbi:MAG: tRNA dihydrouridine synthase, partial [Desulfohalobiaceae bacterium]
SMSEIHSFPNQQGCIPGTAPPAIRPPIQAASPWLAPLAGFSDLPFRLLCREHGCTVACTEMVSAKGLLYNSPGTESLLATSPLDQPLVVQLFGSEPGELSRAVSLLKERGHVFFDLNAGCSVRKVASAGSGAALLKDPGRLEAMVTAMAEAARPGAVGVKIRSGWRHGAPDCREIVPRLAHAGAGWITLHPRTAVQGFSGSADWGLIREVASLSEIPVIASGDLFTAEDGLRCLEETGADAIMFARGALRDPAIFRHFSARKGVPPAFCQKGLVTMIRRHMELSRAYGERGRALLKMRTFVPRYLKSIPGARALRKELTSCTSWEQLESILARIDRS